MTPAQSAARLELVALGVSLVAVSRLADGAAAWLVAGLVLLMMIVGAGQVMTAGPHVPGASSNARRAAPRRGSRGMLEPAVGGIGDRRVGGLGSGTGFGDRLVGGLAGARSFGGGVGGDVGGGLRDGVTRATRSLVARVVPGGVPAEATLAPAVSAVACLGALRLVPVGLAVLPVLALAAVLVDASLRLEIRIVARPRGASEGDRAILVALAIGLAFVAFSGVAALVPDGLVEPGAAGGSRAPLPEGALVLLAAADAFVAFLLGLRLDALRTSRPRDAVIGGSGYALAIAIAAGLVRAAALPRLLGPALLTLVFFLWAAFRGTEPAARRDPRFIWQVVLLAVLGVVVLGWNLMLRAS